MEFRNEIVQYGGINVNLGLPITTNVDRSVHAGVELSSSRNIGRDFKLTGNFSTTYNRIKKFQVTEAVYDNDQNYNLVGYQQVNYDGHTIAGFPSYLGNLIGEYFNDHWRLTYRGRLVGRTYVEDDNREDLSIPPFFTSSVSAELALGKMLNIGNLSFALRVDNILDKRYEASGYGGVTRFRDITNQYWAEYIPAAERSFFSTLKLELK